MSIELGLSIFAIIISLSGLILYFVKFRREKPDLHVEVTKCRHHPSSAKVRQTQLRLEFYVHNRGDRATQLNSLELQTYKQTQSLQESVEAHKSIKEDCLYTLPLRLTDDLLQCTFVLHHTHGEKNFEVTSQKSSKSLSKVGVGFVDW